MKFVEDLAENIVVVVIVFIVTITFVGFVFGLISGVDWEYKGKSYCKQSYENPRSYLEYVTYPFKYGQRIGCFLSKPRFD